MLHDAGRFTRLVVMSSGLLAGLAAGSLMAGPSPRATSMGHTVAPGFAVIELFTSQGCSSCPAADAAVAELGRAARRGGQRIYPLAFHVDYWDRLGWPDPYALPVAKARHAGYSARLSGGEISTPQVVVNGQAAISTVDGSAARLFVASVAATPATVVVALQVEAHDALKRVRWRVVGAPAGVRLNIALVHDGLAVRVARGENAGRVLRQDNVVRRFVSVDPTAGAGVADLPTPADASAAALRVVAYVQDTESLAILGAASGG